MAAFEKDGKPRVAGVVFWVLLILGIYGTVPSIILNIVVQIDSMTNPAPGLGKNWLENLKIVNQQYFPLSLIFTMAGQFIFFAGLTLLLYPKLHGRPVMSSLSIRLGSPLGPVLGLAAGVAVVPLASWLGEFWFWLFPPLRQLIEVFGWSHNITSDPGMLTLYVLAIGLTPAICEELLFRGYLQGTLQRKWSQRSAMLFSSVLFAMIHQNAFGLTTLLFVGVFLGWMFHRFQSLATTAAFHFAYNTTLVLVSMTGYFPGLLREDGTFGWIVTIATTLAWGAIVAAMYMVTRKKGPEQGAQEMG